MTSPWGQLATPTTRGLRALHGGILAGELTIITTEIWNRIHILHAARYVELEATIAELTLLVQALEIRANHYEAATH